MRYIYGEFYHKVLMLLMPEYHANQPEIEQILFGLEESRDATPASLLLNGRTRVTKKMKRNIFTSFEKDRHELKNRIMGLTKKTLGDDEVEKIVNIIKGILSHWECTLPEAKHALTLAEESICLFVEAFHEYKKKRSMLSTDDLKKEQDLIKDKLILVVVYVFVASMDDSQVEDIEVISSEFDAKTQTETLFDTSSGDEVINVEVDHSVFLLEHQIRDACTRWITAAKKSGRMIDYSEAEEQHELMDIPLTALIRSTNEVDDETGCTIEEALFGNGDIPNLVLLSPGGGGKSFLMYSLAEKMLDESCAYDLQGYIPLYVPLNKLNGSSQSIFDYCREMLEFYGAPSEAMQVFNGKLKFKPLLLLDGFNEISSLKVQNMVVEEISEFRSNYPDVRFVISSRYDFTSEFNGRGSVKFIRRELMELKDDAILKYIQQVSKIDENSAKEMWREFSPKMRSTLKRPMALSIFVKTKKHPELSASYPFSSCERLAELLANYNYLLIKSAVGREKEVEDYSDLLSYVGFKMHNEPTFEIGREKLRNWTKDWVMEYNYDQENKSINSIIEAIEKTVLRRHSDGTYSFIHQNFRDFNCARHIATGLMKICEGEIDCCQKLFSITYNDEILELLGEYTQEYKGTDSLYNRVISTVKTRQTEDAVYSVIVQLINSAKIVCEDLHHFDFSDLDLTNISLNGCKLYHVNDDYSRTVASFNNAKISDVTFAPQGHANAVFAMCLVENRFLLSFSQYTVCCYDDKIGTFTTIGAFTGHKPTVAQYIGNGRIAVGDDSKKIHIMCCKTQGNGTEMTVNLEKDISLSFPGKVNRIQPISSDMFAAAVDNGCVYSVRRVENNIEIDLLYSLHDKEDRFELSRCSVSLLETVKRFGDEVAKDKQLYMAFNHRIYVMDLNDGKCSSFYNFDENHSNQIFIYDICTTQSGLFVYYETSFECHVVFFAHYCSKPIDCGMDHIKRGHFEGYSGFCKGENDELYICRDDQGLEEPDAYQLLICDDGSKTPVVNVKALAMGKHTLRVTDAVCLPDNKLATCSSDRSVQIIDTLGQNSPRLFSGHNNGIRSICMPDEETIFCAQYSGEVSRWKRSKSSVDKWYCTNVYPIHSNWIWSIQVHRHNNISYMVTASYDHTVKLTDTLTEKCLLTITLDDQVLSAHFLPDGNIVAHTGNIIYLIRVSYAANNTDDYAHTKTVLYTAKESEYIRDIGIKDQSVIAAVNNNSDDLIAKLKIIDIYSEKHYSNTVAEIEPFSRSIQISDDRSCFDNGRYVIRCVVVDDQYIAICGDVKHEYSYRDIPCIDEVFYGLYDFLRDDLGVQVGTVRTIKNNSGNRLFLQESVSGDELRNIFVVCRCGTLQQIILCNEAEKKVKPSHVSHSFGDAYLDIKVFGEHVYLSSLYGHVGKLILSDYIEANSEYAKLHPEIITYHPKLLFETISGARMCGIDLSNTQRGENCEIIVKRVLRYTKGNDFG